MKQDAGLWERITAAVQNKKSRIRLSVAAVGVFAVAMMVWDWLGEKPKPRTALPQSAATRATSAQRAVGQRAARTMPSETVRSLAPQTLLPQIEADAKRPWSQYEKMGKEEFTLVGYGLRGTELTAEEWQGLGSTSMDYRMADSAFRQQDLLQAMKPKLQARMAAFKSRYFVVEKPVYLGPYDMERKAFPLRPDAAQSLPWSLDGHWGYIKGGNFDLAITNMERFEQYAVADEKAARRLDALSVSQRSGHARVYLFAEDVTLDGRVVTARIMGVELADYDGKPMGKMVSAP